MDIHRTYLYGFKGLDYCDKEMKYKIEKPIKEKEKLKVTIISNGNSERVTISKKTLKQMKKKTPELYKLIIPFF